MNKRDQPYIEITAGKTDQVLDIFGWVLLAALIGLCVYLISVLPSFGEMAYIFGFLGIITYIGFHFLKKHPHRFNYLVKITPENAYHQYSLALRMLRMVNLCILIEFITFLVVMYMNEKQGKELDEGLFIIGIITLGFIPLGYYFWKMSSK